MATTETTTGCAVAGTWACGLMLQLESVTELFSRYPSVGFITLSLVGSLVGWCLLLERGVFDGDGAKPKFRSMLTRLVMGGCVGVATAILFRAFGDGAGHQGIWMLVSSLIAMFPLEAASGTLPDLIAKWRGLKNDRS